MSNNCSQLPDEIVVGKILAEIFILVARYSVREKPPISGKEKRKWQKAQNHLYLVIKTLKLPTFQHRDPEEAEQYREDKDNIISKMIRRNQILRLIPLQEKSIGQSLTIFLKEKGRLKYWQLDYYRERNNQPPTSSLDKPISSSGDDGEKQNLGNMIIESSKPIPWEELIENAPQREYWDYLENDPDGLLQGCHVRNRPDCNCHILVKKRLLEHPATTWGELAKELNSTIGTLSGYFTKKCIPLLQEIAQKFGLIE